MTTALPRPVRFAARLVRRPQNISAPFRFLTASTGSLDAIERARMLAQIYRISYAVPCPHTEHEILSFVNAVNSMPPDLPGCLVEAGCYKGGSTTKFSLVARALGRRLVVFDSFEGIPQHTESHSTNIYGRPASFPAGSYSGSLQEVRAHLERFGAPEVCRLVKGWFSDTMPSFHEPLAAAYIDVDLASSTATCVKYLYPLLVPGGMLFSQDGHLPLVLDVLANAEFWEKEVGCRKPPIRGFGKSKILRIDKPA